jgi:hypothetical protein
MRARSASVSRRVTASSSNPTTLHAYASSARHSSASAPWPTAGTSRPDSRTPFTVTPSRDTPASASTIASKAPSSRRRRRVSMLPRSMEMRRSGRSAWSCSARRWELVPTWALCGSASRWAPSRVMRRVPRGGAGGHRREHHAFGQGGGEVLHRVHGEVGAALGERGLNLRDEEPLAANL